MQPALTDQTYWDEVWQFIGAYASEPSPRVETAMTDRFVHRVRLVDGDLFDRRRLPAHALPRRH